jgi:hypothetical protein
LLLSHRATSAGAVGGRLSDLARYYPGGFKPVRLVWAKSNAGYGRMLTEVSTTLGIATRATGDLALPTGYAQRRFVPTQGHF